MKRVGFLDGESRKDLIELARDGLAANRLARRANALVLLDDGMSFEAIARVLLLDDDTIRTWYRLYQEDGIEGLASFGYEGGACRLSVEQRDKLATWITETLPRTTREIGAWIEAECGIAYQGRSGLIALLHRLSHLRHRRPGDRLLHRRGAGVDNGRVGQTTGPWGPAYRVKGRPRPTQQFWGSGSGRYIHGSAIIWRPPDGQASRPGLTPGATVSRPGTGGPSGRPWKRIGKEGAMGERVIDRVIVEDDALIICHIAPTAPIGLQPHPQRAQAPWRWLSYPQATTYPLAKFKFS